MAKRRRSQRDHGPSRHVEEVLSFVELHGFTDDLSDLGLTDDDLHALQVAIMAAPSRPPVVRGSGGLRKIRFAPAGWRVGKSGAIRVCYVYFAEWQIILLVVAYSKDEMEDLPPTLREEYKRMIEGIRREFARRFTSEKGG